VLQVHPEMSGALLIPLGERRSHKNTAYGRIVNVSY
jgi:hypothetical protein